MGNSKIDLRNKKVILIVPVYFGYDKEIKAALENAGAQVTVIYENIKEINFLYRFIWVYIPKKRDKLTVQYYKKHIMAAGNGIDYVLAIRASSLTDEIMGMIKAQASSNCRYLMYQWDSIKNNLDVVPMLHHFQSVATFDINDAKAFGWKYRPLFFVDGLVGQLERRDIDVAYVCTIHSKRIQLFRNLKKYCEQKGLALHSHIFIKRILFFKYKFLDKNPVIVDAVKKDLCFYPLSLQETYTLYERSKIVVDYTHPGQTGFTMRTIEAMGNGCKLITNNPLIKQADFYNPNNILVYEGTDVEIPDWFVQSPYEEPEEKIYRKYALTEWLKDILTQ